MTTTRRAVRPARRSARSTTGSRSRVDRGRRRRRRAVLRRHRLRALRRRRLRRRVLGPHRRRRRARRAAARGHRPLDRPGVGGEPRLADLLPRRAVDRVLRGVRVDHAHAVRAADARRARHRAARLELRVPQGGRAHVEQRDFGASFAISSVLVPFCMGAVAGAIASGRVPAGGKAGDPWSSWINPTSILGGVLAVDRVRVPRGGLPGLGRAPARRRRHGRVLPPAGGGCRGRRRRRRVRRDLRAARRRPLRVRRAHVARAPARDHLRALRHRLARAARARARTAARACSRPVRSPPSSARGASRSGPTCSRRR